RIRNLQYDFNCRSRKAPGYRHPQIHGLSRARHQTHFPDAGIPARPCRGRGRAALRQSADFWIGTDYLLPAGDGPAATADGLEPGSVHHRGRLRHGRGAAGGVAAGAQRRAGFARRYSARGPMMTESRKQPLLKAENVTRILPLEVPVTLVKDASVEVFAGEFISITGPSGSGKSSLLYLLGLLDRPTG